MVIDHALGIAGGARGVIQGNGATLVGRRRPREVGTACGDEVLVFDLAQAVARPGINRIVDVDDERLALQLRERRTDLAGEFAIGYQSFGLAVGENIADGGRVETRVDGVEHGSQHGHAVMRLQHGRDVRQHHGNGIAGADALARES